MIELDIPTLERCPNVIEFIRSIHMIANDKIGQTPAEFDNLIDNIFKVFAVLMFKRVKIYLQHTTQHSSNQLEDAPFWCPLVFFHVTKLFLLKNCPRTR